MTSDERELKHLVNRHLPSPTHMEFTAARERVLNQLRATPAHLQTTRIAESAPPVSWWRAGVSLAAAAALFGLVVTVSFRHADWIATVEAADGSSYTLEPNTVLSATDARGLQLTLKDGSRVEMRSAAELSIAPAADGIGIRLLAGDIIVNAVKQGDGHLSVRTSDMTISVDGTVFLVKTVADGSRVAVIEGEVRVREGALERRLHPGEQVSTSPALGARSLRDDIAWSRDAGAHLAILDSFTRGMAQTTGALAPLARQADVAGAQTPGTQAAPEFEEASIRECDPDNLPETLAGARGGGPNSLLMTSGHLYAQCMTLATLIRTALEYGPVELEFRGGQDSGGRRAGRGMKFEAVYGLGVEDGRRVRGGPDWIRIDRYTIEAVGDGQVTAEMMRGPMLRDLLERRFQLKAHVEAEQIPAYALVVGPGGLKALKPFRDSDCAREVSDSVKAERARKGWTGPLLITEAAYFGVKPSCGGVYGETNGPNYHFELVNSTPGMVAGFASSSIGVRVIDRTNIADRFTYTWDFGIDEQTPRALEDLQRGKTWNPKPGWDSPMTIPKAPSIFAAVEQLGLKLEPIRVPREFIVIDRVERPAPN